MRARRAAGGGRKNGRAPNVAVGLTKLGAVGAVVPPVRPPLPASVTRDGASQDWATVDAAMHASTIRDMARGVDALRDSVASVQSAAERLGAAAEAARPHAASLRGARATRARGAALLRRMARWKRQAAAFGVRGGALRGALEREVAPMERVLKRDAARLRAEGQAAFPERLTHVTVLTSAPAGVERAKGEAAPRRGLRNSVTRWDLVSATLHGLAESPFATTFGQVANFCPACGSALAAVPAEGRMLCVSCRKSFVDLAADAGVGPEGGGGKGMTHRANQTRVYVVEKLNQMQARHPGVIPVEVMLSVMRHMFERMAVRTPASVEAITRAQTQAAMRAVGFTSYAMVSRVKMGLTGIRPPQLDPVLKAEVLHMMDIIQFDSRIMRKRNENNMSLYYSILHCLLMRGRYEFLPEMSIIRGQNNLMVKDLSQMFPIFQKNDWGPFRCIAPEKPVPYALPPLPPGSRSFARRAARSRRPADPRPSRKRRKRAPPPHPRPRPQKRGRGRGRGPTQ